ncbi:MetQ/NlpA family ABC transporter substrate-binding protein [Fructobacillus sp. M1-13]|uniref:Lipoprotein n=1 Tax=Fructobacillus papyriferae TaxID=2713171 RepID=A0ABS5QQH3_9LACO|nr:MetQ/NlpA family ABC transporter substrate-binding protein [Fructobacillus papyriferae]MBS9335351.1 MetQ/NlpA family ABC transporter substrate-binding protein [Fructobacillus papyriferae]MCD2158980.1 MetQ/NlpA family ABC transporter substrate-binding protein [Fructobacillus papyriferae]
MSNKSKLINSILLVIILILGYFSFVKPNQQSQKTVTIGIMAANKQDDAVWNQVSKTAKTKYGITLKFKRFTDYSQPNKALDNGDVDLNAFQHYAFLDAYNSKNKTNLTAIGQTFIAPIHLYSQSYKSISDFQDGDTIVVPNDASNESRALYVLKNAGLIELSSGSNLKTTKDITKNPKNLKIKEISADQTARTLGDAKGVVVNGNYATAAGLSLKDSIFTEPLNKDAKLWINVIAARSSDKQNKLYKEVVKSFQTKEVKQVIQKQYGDAEQPAWDKNFN